MWQEMSLSTQDLLPLFGDGLEQMRLPENISIWSQSGNETNGHPDEFYPCCAYACKVHIWVQPYMQTISIPQQHPCVECVTLQDEVINQFSAKTSLKLNLEKFEVVKISANSQENLSTIHIGNRDISTTKSARCLGVWWNPRLIAKDSVHENINKSRRYISLLLAD